ncbi:Git3 domain-containing protein [Favolaschia claudopus]|uniref:Git3 domain-containing protein n=1 Tax=Favolaschia claudopus TaxID=2862362 RepID=A0AAW0DZT1_9AGAR
MPNHTFFPDGSEWLQQTAYTSREVHGVTVLVVFSCFSLVAVVGLLLTICLSAFNTRSWTNDKHPHLFVRTHVAAYFISLLISDIIQAIGSIMNAQWIRDMAVVVGDVCTIQGVLKQIADVSIAVWTFAIALHTFFLLFLELKSSRFVLVTTLVAGWAGIAAIVFIGPAGLNASRHGPFYGISGYWCWISPHYANSRVTLDYMFMFMAAAFSFILYMLIFLRLRGNIVVEGRRIHFQRVGTPWRGKQFENQAMTIAKQMLLYPVAYTILILPIAASRLSYFAGNDVPFEVTIFSGAVFLLDGVVNVVLFTMTRRILPPESFKFPKWAISRPQPIPEYNIETGPDSYYQSSGTYSESYDEKEKEYKSEMDATPPQLRITTAVNAPPMLAPPPQVYRGSGESLYDMYETANSPIPLTPPDDVAARHIGYGG